MESIGGRITNTLAPTAFEGRKHAVNAYTSMFIEDASHN